MGWFENLRSLKAESNMSMREIATKSGIPEPTLEKIFSGATKNPGVNTIQSLVHALGYSLNDIDPGAKKSSSTAEAAPREKQMLSLYRKLNTEGQEKLLDYADDLVSSGKYIKSSQDNLEHKKRA